MPSSTSFDIRSSVNAEPVCRLRVIGELDTAAAPRLIRSLREARHRASPARVLLDLSGVTFIDCSGLTALLTAARNARREGYELEVDEQVSLPVQRMIDMTGVDRLLWP